MKNGHKGLTAMKNGHGPWVGQVNVNGIGACELLAGLSTDPGVRAFGSCIVAIISHGRNWSWTTDEPLVCETVARVLQSMGEVAPAQLDGIGFVSEGWERLGKG